VSTGDDDVPHTGTMHYEDGVPHIPALALGVHSAEALDAELAAGKVERIRLRCSCRTLPDVEQWNVVGEIPGLDHPEEILVVGGHLDAWETGDGAQDDGAGCCQALEAARLLLVCGVRPSRTIRVVLYANEENGSRGGREYARLHAQERHVLAMESDSGGFAPRGIALGFPQDVLSRLRPYGEPLAAVGAERVLGGGGGSDVAPLKGLGAILGSLRVDDARYFDLHHSANDTLAAVNSRELELGAITMAYWLALLGNSGLAM